MTAPTQDHHRAADLFGGIRPPTPAELQALHHRLEVRAEAEDLLDIAYRTVDTPVGTLLLAATRAGLLRVAYQREGLDSVLEGLARQVSPRILFAPQRTDAAARQLEEYFAGDRHRFDLPLDLSLSHGFRRTVLAYLPRIRYGMTASYGQVAAAVDNPRAVRAVGTACATNPLPLIVPCHRVIRTDGLIGSYLAGPEVKQQLLDLEATA
ncbi:MAG TPA: methylated-DNA--[protein]-cysteine S-methyltransferase [Acidimicrobiales bacterium]|jgi:methylated-DNA-[protein]-cysteine S-methyltransferase|nr:methylated-DNA--[protein]-cysteine S-methyltransferase [Acidimicrobiales bacterium]